jgi:hypothetical protein
MLRASADLTETTIDLAGVNGNPDAAATGVTYGRELMLFAEAVASRNEDRLRDAREALNRIAGPAVLVDAAGVAANFQRMVRIADAMGIPVDNMADESGQRIRQELNLERFPSARNSLTKQPV